jgi:hypothetical protein
MPKPFKELTLDAFIDVLELFPFTRKIDMVHVHHTFHPDHAEFFSRDPIRSIDGMFEFHTQPPPKGRGFIDIAQHITIDPVGHVWTGRNWNLPPASATGFNGNGRVGPFMFEMIGNFDRGQDEFKDPQRRTALQVIAAVQRRFGLAPDAVRFHNQMSEKTCPGSAIELAAMVEAVRAAHEELAAATRSRAATTFGDGSLAVRETVRTVIDVMANAPAGGRAVPLDAGEELPEDGGDAGGSAPSSRRSARGGREFTAAERELFRKHVVNLRFGAFSTGGAFQTDQADVDRIFGELLPNELEARKAANQKLRLVFYAHGGLIGEVSALETVVRRLTFWRENGTYPIFFVWETGLPETIVDIVKGLFTGRRDLFDASDRVIEALARDGGLAVWTQMKRSAAVSVLEGGGALEVARQTREFWNEHHQDMEIHAAGHSAGAIFQAEFLPALTKAPASGGTQLRLSSLHFLAPAITVELFKKKLFPLIGSGKAIDSLTVYTMNKSLEEDDKAGPYRKSLLYLVSRAFETMQPTPILGLEESIRHDVQLLRFFGLSVTSPKVADLLFSQTSPTAPPKSATRSTSHGDFDNDVATMNSVVRRIIQAQDSDEIFSFKDETGARGLFDVDPSAAPVFESPGAPEPAAVSGRFQSDRSHPKPATAGRRRALCVGIDTYPSPNQLAGCVHDTNTWARTLQAFDFAPTLLVNEQATRRDILASLEQLLGAARPGDVLAFIYAGHGTTVTDLDGDELDGQDEALCPVDFADGALIVDDDLRALFARTPDGVNFTCFMDCCHSGTITRMIAGLNPSNARATATRRARFIPPNATINAAHQQFRRALGLRAAAPLRDPATMHEVVFSACLPTEVAFEENGAGDFTTRATGLLGRGVDHVTHAEFQTRVTREFGRPARQNPMLDCSEASRTRQLFQPLVP